MTVLERIKKIGETWFLTEPLLFAAYCSHSVVENDTMDIPIRTGNRKIENSPSLLENVRDSILAEMLKIEMFRILLKHPYQRQPPYAEKALLTMASNVTIADVYDVPLLIRKQMSGTSLQLPHGLCFEEYYQMLKEQVANASSLNGDGSRNKGSKDAQVSELWEEDQEACCDINDMIEVAIASNTWGTVPGSMQGLIKASMKVDMNYRRMLSIFKTSVLSSKRHLTRMRPNRRFGFDAMGSRYDLKANLLIAVDVSGSVSDRSLEFFFSIIGRLFKFGVEKLDVLQFDSKIKDSPEAFKKARKSIKIIGRGGTDFQPVADYYCNHPEYDGLIFFTDGFAESPTYSTKRVIDVLWVLSNKSDYESNSERLKKLKRNRVTYIPRTQ